MEGSKIPGLLSQRHERIKDSSKDQQEYQQSRIKPIKRSKIGSDEEENRIKKLRWIRTNRHFGSKKIRRIKERGSEEGTTRDSRTINLINFSVSLCDHAIDFVFVVAFLIFLRRITPGDGSLVIIDLSDDHFRRRS
jgi:hypothetical protein